MVCTGVVCIIVAAHCPCTYSFPKNAMLLVLGIFCLLFFSCFFAEYHCTRLYCNMYVQIRVPKPLPSACFQPKTLLTQCPFCSNHGTSARGKELSQLSQLPLSSSSSCFSSTSNRRSSLDWLCGAGRAYFTRRLSQLKGTEYSQQATAPVNVVSSAASQRDSGRHRRVIKEHTLDKEGARLFIAGTNETRGKRIYIQASASAWTAYMGIAGRAVPGTVRVAYAWSGLRRLA